MCQKPIQEDLEHFIPHCKLDVLVPTLKDFILNYLNANSALGSEVLMRDVLLEIPQLESEPWIDAFPKTPRMKHIVYAYKLFCSAAGIKE